MQLFTDHAEDTLVHFIKRIEDAPFSWRLMSLEFRFPVSIDEVFFQKQCHQFLVEYFSNIECDIYWLSSRRLILILFQGRALPLEKCIDLFMKAIAYSDVTTIFDILDFSVDWKNFLILVKNTLSFPVDEPKKQTVDVISKEPVKEPVLSKKEQLGFSIKLDSQKIAAGNPLRRNRGKPLMLLVEDDPLYQKMVKVSLEGYDIVLAETARQALVYYQRHIPDIVFLDINLPDGNGLNILQDISDADPVSYVVMLSGDAMREKIVTSLERGAKTFIAKPFNRKRLLDIIGEFITYKKQSKA
jgi:two-component system chemotaxis response regulator CheY